uniref:Uncharacterized protein n=1 Tax=Arundo donax TaxID=35708 RepID=A0A0A8YGU5_ARUDO
MTRGSEMQAPTGWIELEMGLL